MKELTQQEQEIKDLAEKYRSDMMNYEANPEAASLAFSLTSDLYAKCKHRLTTTYGHSASKDWIVCDICGKGWFSE